MDSLDPTIDVDLDTTAQEILLAASTHDIPTLDQFLGQDPANVNVRDPETLTTPLHAALQACEEQDKPSEESEAVLATVRHLLEHGAIWNDLNSADETPGCIALRLRLREAYELIVQAGVRAELLLHRLDGFQLLAADSESDDDDDEADDEQDDADVAADDNTQVESVKYLASSLNFGTDRLLDSSNNGVMMAWETDIMTRSVDALLANIPTPRVLNIGHGMGIIDGIFQARNPIRHDIIEAHPGVLADMRQRGWFEKGAVTVHQGRWQDVIASLKDVRFDAVYFDTFAEDYAALKEFFASHVPNLLAHGGRFGFFNGLGADRQVCQDVYKRVLEIDLFEAGLDVAWTVLKVPDLKEAGEWDGVRRSYWALETYSMPTCSLSI